MLRGGLNSLLTYESQASGIAAVEGTAKGYSRWPSAEAKDESLQAGCPLSHCAAPRDGASVHSSVKQPVSQTFDLQRRLLLAAGVAFGLLRQMMHSHTRQC
jgi:hypothetical protein